MRSAIRMNEAVIPCRAVTCQVFGVFSQEQREVTEQFFAGQRQNEICILNRSL